MKRVSEKQMNDGLTKWIVQRNEKLLVFQKRAIKNKTEQLFVR